MSHSLEQAPSSTEPPSFLEKGLEPVAISYVALPIKGIGEATRTITADESLRPPCRRCLQDALPGEAVTLHSYDPFPSTSVSPYRGSGPIVLHAEGCKIFGGKEIPDRQGKRTMSLRVYESDDMLVAAELTKGDRKVKLAGEMLADEKAKYINVHNWVPGCFAFRIERAA